MESMEDAIHRLHVLLHGREWYAGKVLANPNLHNSIIAYVKYNTLEIEEAVPRLMEGYDVRVHFAGSLGESAKPNTTLGVFNPSALAPQPVVAAPEPSSDDFMLAPAGDIHNALWNLRRACGRENLENIFYEIHDGTNALTCVSKEFPEVRTKLQTLYDEFGFDILFEEIDDFAHFP